MNLVIVESPQKAKKIQGFLGSNYIVRASLGHIRDMPNKEIAVDINNNFKPTYQISKDKRQIVTGLKKLVQAANTVYLATDDDREGEAIAWHLIEVLGIPANSPRVKFHEITKKEVLRIIPSKTEQLNMNMVNAQQARRVLDRLVGYEVSPVLWNKVKGAKSAGRVQSPVTRIIVERENEIRNFVSSSSYKIKAMCNKDSVDFVANFETTLTDKDSANILLKHYSLNGISLKVENVERKPIFKKPAEPFTTSTFQQAISSSLGLPPKKAMACAQQLYMDGLITYMRTDSPTLSQEAIDEAKNIITIEHGEEYSQERQFKTKDGSAQEAHEAIRPTDLTTVLIDADDATTQKVYTIIRNRVLASQMANAKIDQTIVSFRTQDEDNHLVIAKGEVVVFDGFIKLTRATAVKDNLLPELNINDTVLPDKIIAKENWKKPKSRYDEAKLVKKLESLGIGRPSTFATMVDTVQQRGYVVKSSADGSKVVSYIEMVSGNR